MDVERRRVGRPNIRDPRNLTFSIKLNEKERDHLVFIMEELNLSIPEVFRYCLEEVFERLYYG